MFSEFIKSAGNGFFIHRKNEKGYDNSRVQYWPPIPKTEKGVGAFVDYYRGTLKRVLDCLPFSDMAAHRRLSSFCRRIHFPFRGTNQGLHLVRAPKDREGGVNETPMNDIPKHTKEVEKVANQIIVYGLGAALICTIIVMVI